MPLTSYMLWIPFVKDGIGEIVINIYIMHDTKGVLHLNEA